MIYTITKFQKFNPKRTHKGLQTIQPTTYMIKSIRITINFSARTIKNKDFQALKENDFQGRLLYTAKPTFKFEREIKIFHNKKILKKYVTTKIEFQKMLM